uniref:RNA polymerase I-specific transcription initiation factor RRN3 n=1 Tax=Syphacia muris TaxID=451379 RepID=A0A0N5AQF2_9BILA
MSTGSQQLGDPAATLTYRKVCNAIDSIERWQSEGVTDFLDQFINISNLLDVKCMLLVEKLAGIKWHVVPAVVRKKYVNMLRKLAVQHVCHTEILLCSFTSNMLPTIRSVPEKSGNMPTVQSLFFIFLDSNKQNDIYEMAHEAVKFVLSCFPMSIRLLEKALRRNFPFFKIHILKYNAYVRNLLLLYEYAVDIREDIWNMLLESFVVIDVSLLFFYDLFTSFRQLYYFLVAASFFRCLLKYLTNFIEWLWDFIVVPSKSPNDWKKAHAAACYLGSLFSVAKFVDINFCCKWMEKFVNWCTKYVNETIGGSAGASAGTLRHGTFYAVFQALLVTFIYRYSEIIANYDLEKVRQWSLGRIIHCLLQPLSYIDPIVASNFASISRSLQLVYCSHILPQAYNNVNLAFEPFFPFESYFLTRSSSFMANLTIRFNPLLEDEGEIRRQRNGSRSNPMSFQGAGSLEFLEDLKRDNDMENGMFRLLALHIFCFSRSLFFIIETMKLLFCRRKQGFTTYQLAKVWLLVS